MRISAIVLIVSAVLLQSCGRHNATTETRTVFRYNESSGITSLDPAYARGQADIWACNQLYNGLLQMNDQLEPIPCIASGYTILNQGTLYRFTLRKDVYFHNNPCFRESKGRKVTALDFVYSFNRLVDPGVASPGSWVLNQVLADTSGKPIIYAESDSVLCIELKNPFPPFAGLLTTQYCSVVPKEAIDYYGKDFRKHPVGTGPFQYFLWEDRSALVLHRNPVYFEFENENRLPYLDAIQISFLSDKQAAFLEFIKGNLDFISGIDAGYKDELLTRDGCLRKKYEGKIEMETSPYLNTEYLGFMIDPALSEAYNPLLDVRIRQAINYGFDRRKMIRYLRNGIGIPGVFGFIPPGLPSTDTLAAICYDYDPKTTSRLLAEAGYPGGKGLPSITLSATKEYQDLCEFIQGQLAESGIQIKLEVNQGATHREMVAHQKLQFFRASWIADYPDAENYLSLFYSKNFAPVGPNYTHFNSTAFDSLYLASLVETEIRNRYDYYRKMDRLIMNSAPVVVLYYDKVIRLRKPNISGLGCNAMNLLTLKKVRKKQEN